MQKKKKKKKKLLGPYETPLVTFKWPKVLNKCQYLKC